MANQPLPPVVSECILLDPDRLESMGAVAIHERKGAVHLVSTRDRTGDRLWTPWYRRAQRQ